MLFILYGMHLYCISKAQSCFLYSFSVFFWGLLSAACSNRFLILPELKEADWKANGKRTPPSHIDNVVGLLGGFFRRLARWMKAISQLKSSQSGRRAGSLECANGRKQVADECGPKVGVKWITFTRCFNVILLFTSISHGPLTAS